MKKPLMKQFRHLVMTHRVWSIGRCHCALLHSIPHSSSQDHVKHIVEWEIGQSNIQVITTKRRRTRNCTRMTCRSFMEPAVMLMECAHHGGEIVATNQRPSRTGFCVHEPCAPRDFTARPRDRVAPPTTRLSTRHDRMTSRPADCASTIPYSSYSSCCCLLLTAATFTPSLLDFHFSMNPFSTLRN